MQIEAIRALGRIGDPSSAPSLLKLLTAADTDPHVRLEALQAIGALHIESGSPVVNTLLDFLSDPDPAMRAAALRSTAALDTEGFVTVLSGLDPDPHWSVRAALASTLATLPPENGLPRLREMLNDTDQRVIAPVLDALVKLKAADAPPILLAHLKADDPVVRAAAAAALAS